MSEPFRPWTDDEVRIYKFHDGVSVRAVDPLAVLRKLQAVPGLSLETDLALASASEAGGEFAVEGERAIERLVGATRDVFGVKPIELNAAGEPVGLTETECLRLLTNFGHFVAQLQESSRPLANSPPPTGSAASGDSGTSSTSASG